MALGQELLQENFTQASFFSFDENMIDVQCLCPGPVIERSANDRVRDHVKNWFLLSPKKVVEASLRDLCYGHINHSQRTFSFGHWIHDLMRVVWDLLDLVWSYKYGSYIFFEYFGF